MGAEMKDLNVVRWQVPALILSFVVIVGSWVYTFTGLKGFNFGIDFKAGINLTVEMDSQTGEMGIRDALQEFNPQVQTAGTEGNRYIIRIADDQNVDNFQKTTADSVLKTLNDTFGKAAIINQEYIQSSFAGALATQTIWLTLIAMGLILLYIWVRFKFNYAISAIVAIFHDVLFLLGFIGVLGLEFSTASIAAVLTIIGYSLNDTIVIFDRIRENARSLKDMSFSGVINRSITQSLNRTIITSLTTLLAVLAIVFFASGTIRTFALNLVAGIIAGTYSSIFVASPVLLGLHNAAVRRAHASVTSKRSDTAGSAAESKTLPRTTRHVEPVKQSAEEIALATEKRKSKKLRKKKK